MDYSTLRPGQLRLLPNPDHEAGWRQNYVAMQAEMFSTAPPVFDELIEVIKAFEVAFNPQALQHD